MYSSVGCNGAKPSFSFNEGKEKQYFKTKIQPTILETQHVLQSTIKNILVLRKRIPYPQPNIFPAMD